LTKGRPAYISASGAKHLPGIPGLAMEPTQLAIAGQMHHRTIGVRLNRQQFVERAFQQDQIDRLEQMGYEPTGGSALAVLLVTKAR
jgi:hypothetical protein